jgi:hypothetical protein
MKNIVLLIKTAAFFIAIFALISSCKPQASSEIKPSSEIQPFPEDPIKVWSSNKHQFTAGIARGCPDRMGSGAITTTYYTIKLFPMDYEDYVFDSLWVAEPSKSVSYDADSIIAYNLYNATAQSFKLSQVVERGAYTLSAIYAPDPCQSLEEANKLRSEQLPTKAPITPNTIGSGVISCYQKRYGPSSKRYIILKNMTRSYVMGW